jgi:hypothetical protein
MPSKINRDSRYVVSSGVADDVAEIAAAAEGAFLDDVLGAAGVGEHGHTELGGLGPERIVLR